MRRILSRRIMPDTPPVEKKDYLCVEFSGTGEGDVRTIGNGPGTDDTKPYYMKYLMMSRDGIHWETTRQMRVPAGGKVYIKGKGTSFYNPLTKYGWRFNIDTVWHSGSTDKVYATISGNIMSLLYDDDFEDKTEVGDYAFYMLFFAETTNNSIVDVSRLKLPATTVGQYVYASMFQANNQGAFAHPFTKPPKLPATTLGAHCYENMFAYSRLDEMPDLPATTLAEGCYQNMFAHCSIKEAKILPATTFATNCYAYMFGGQKTNMHIPHNMLPATTLISGCYSTMFKDASITDIPSDLLPATTLASYCYKSMFEGCTALTYIPDRLLPATALTVDCYMNMFKGCTNLTRVPRNLLPATTLADDCYQSMFEGCTSLASLPYGLLPAMTMVNYTYKTMFKGCTSLRNIPGNLLPATTLSSRCYESMFEGCSSLLNVPSVLPAESIDVGSYQKMFKGCSSITEIPKGFLHATYINAGGCQNMFEGCSGLTEIGSPLLIENTRLAGLALGQMFKGCTSLVNVDKGLLPTSNFNGNSVYFGMFQGCTSLTNTIKFTDVVAQSCYQNMYDGCVALTDFEDLPATTLSKDCYKAMFMNCTSLTDLSGKRLPAILSSTSYGTYQSMFEGCENLAVVPADFIATTRFPENCCCRMFYGCKSLTVAPYLNPTYEGSEYNLSADGYACQEMFAECYDETTVNGETVYTGLTRIAPLPNESAGKLTFLAVRQHAYERMFMNCKALTELPILSIKYAGQYACGEMFSGCSSITHIDANLFANSVQGDDVSTLNYWASKMFYQCDGLTTIADNLLVNHASANFQCMFEGCTGITTTPNLPDNVRGYFSSMFKDCISLTSPKNLTSAANDTSYDKMFAGCTKLITPPAIAVSGTNIRFSGLFADCTKLSACPTMTVTGTQASYDGMFKNCITLTSFSNVTFSNDAWRAGDGSSGGMFEGCTALTGGSKVSGTDAIAIRMFKGCKKLSTIEIAFTATDATSLGLKLESMFEGCSDVVTENDVITYTGLTTVNGNISGKVSSSGLMRMFFNCKALTTPPAINVQTALGTSSSGYTSNAFEQMFYSCKSLVNFANTDKIVINGLNTRTFYQTFAYCDKLKKSIAFECNTTAAGQECYYGMFQGCTALEEPALELTSTITTLASYCYVNMYYECSNMEAPAHSTENPYRLLPAVNSAFHCYRFMFRYCSKLSHIYCALGSHLSDYTYSWTEGVAADGVFYGNSNNFNRGISGIPDNWEVESIS